MLPLHPLTPLQITPPPRHCYIKRVSNKRWIRTAGMQVWLEDLQSEDQRASATRREIRDFQGEHFKYSVECITPSGHSHSSITNWNHFNSSCVGRDPIGITSSSNGWGARWGPKKKHNQEGNGKISEITVCFAQMCIMKITLFCMPTDLNKVALKDPKTMKMKNISTCQYRQRHVTLCKAFLKLEEKQTLQIITVLNESKNCVFSIKNMNAKANKCLNNTKYNCIICKYNIKCLFSTQHRQSTTFAHSYPFIISGLKSVEVMRRVRQKGRKNKHKQKPGYNLVLDSTEQFKLKPGSRLLSVHCLLA